MSSSSVPLSFCTEGCGGAPVYQPYTFQMSVEQYEWNIMAYYTVIVLLLILALGLLIWGIVAISQNNSQCDPQVQYSAPPPAARDVGSSTNGSVNIGNATALPTPNVCLPPRAVWDVKVNRCRCVPPFFGPLCERQSHDINYYGLGPLGDCDLTYDSITAAPGSGMLSFVLGGGYDPTSCTSQCSQTEGCYGVYYDGARCELITSQPVLRDGGTVTYDPYVQSKVFLIRNKTFPLVTDRVLAYASGLSPRFTAESQPGTAIIWDQTVTTVPFTPRYLVNAGRAIGVWSLYPFDASQYDAYINGQGGANVYIDVPSGEVEYSPTFPPQFQGRTLYAYYRRTG